MAQPRREWKTTAGGRTLGTMTEQDHRSDPIVRHIAQADFSDPRVIALLNTHLVRARAETAPGSAHALDLAALQSSDIKFWTIWDDQTLQGIGALKQLSLDHGEVKSMHTAEPFRGKGVAGVMLRHIIATARARGMSRLSLETGSWDYFRPAHAFYRKHGFRECPPFGDYLRDPNSLFMSLNLHSS
jgi:putative acetyltransferase